MKNKKNLKLMIALLLLIAFLVMWTVDLENRPPKVEISMTSYSGNIEYILYDLGLDFDLVTMGANCYTGVQKNEFKTEKYGILHTEFRYCASSGSQVLRVYNDEKDQKLREPREGELYEYDYLGLRKWEID